MYVFYCSGVVVENSSAGSGILLAHSSITIHEKCVAQCFLLRETKKKNIREYDVTADTFTPAAK